MFWSQKNENNYKLRGKTARYFKSNVDYLDWLHMQDLYDLITT
jgi:hypothetical protein